MNVTWYVIMFELIKKVFIEILASVPNVCNHTKFTSLINQKCITRSALIDFNPDECNQLLSIYG